MADPQSAAYAAGLAAVSTAVAWTGFGKFVSVWIGGEISDRVGRKKLMIGGAALYIICFLGFLFTKSALVASVCGFASGVATSGFWDASGYPAVQEAYPAAPGSALVGIKFFVSLSGMVYPLLVVHNANSGNWKLNVIIPLVMSIVCLCTLQLLHRLLMMIRRKRQKERKTNPTMQCRQRLMQRRLQCL